MRKQINQQEDENNIDSLLADIENEFKELDDILKEVDEVTGGTCGNEEHVYSSNFAPGV